ncbi:disease resistance protein RGA2-like [Salvia divinorum]|uniref:Disease resistance protein RGA2-like n=1 Tax=Salvia divinorum TaxID=28513 RepID=A0ABD1FU29_SALDI
MAEEAMAAILQVVVQNLIDHSKKEISLVRGLDKEAEKLVGRLGTLHEFLNDAEMRSIPGGAVKSWLKKLEDVAFDADNVLDELNYHLLSKQINPIKQKILSCFSSSNHIARSRSMAIRIQEINENLESINNEATELGLVGRLAVVPTTLVDAAFETDAFTVDPIFIGRDEVVSEIVEILSDSVTSDERLISIHAIVGMGGLGKTTLTRNVFNRQKEENRFESHIWVHVSRTFDPIILFKKILKELTYSDQVEVGSRQDILRKLQEALRDKTCLLILDDVWNQDRPKWDDFINSLLGVTSVKGNAIVVTTRNMEVASTVKSLHTHELKGLSHADCWSIIKAKTFGKEDVPPEFEAIGRKIAARCQGLPLAANVVGGALCYKSEQEWLSIEEKWLSHDEGDHITEILKLSFDNLSPQSLKKCFAYCSIYPKGHRIERRNLIEYWMAEGFLEASNEMESIGDKFINVLLHNSLLQVAERDGYGNVESCVMHDLVHDLACSVLGSSNNTNGTSRVRYMIHDGESRVSKEVAKYLRTLFFKGNIYGNMFADFEHLHVLVLADFDCKKLPGSIRKLIHLRKLDISLTGIFFLPDWIGELHQLQTLYGGYLFILPNTLKYLTSLRHLYISQITTLPAEIGKLTSLQTLEYFKVGTENGCKIEELGSLKGLKGKLKISKLERVHNKEEAEKASLSSKAKLLELCFAWDMYREGETTSDEKVLEGLQPPSDLKKLVIEGFKGKRFPTWTQKMAVIENAAQGSWISLNKLIEVRLSQCSECEEIPMFGQLPNLKSLSLEGLSNVKSINSSLNVETLTVFPALEKLVLHGMPKLEKWPQAEFEGASDVKVFPRLQYLEIEDCKQLTSFPNHSSPGLKHLIIRRTSSCMPLEKLTALTMLCTEGIDDLEHLPDWLFYSNPNLLVLKIEKCPKLTGLPDGLGTLNSLKELIVRECPNLRDGVCSINSLETLVISDCPNLERITDDIGIQQSQGSHTSLRSLEIYECIALSYLPCELVGSSLEKLVLVNLSSLKNLPEVVNCLPKSPPRLTELRISGVSQFTATYSVDVLRKLNIDASMWGSVESVNGIIEACNPHSLTDLELKGMENMPESMQHLNALSHLKLEDFGMEELPEWLGNLSSLVLLQLHDCKKLRRLPTADAMRRLTRLEYLDIEGCLELCVEKQSDAAASQWPSISHITYISVDGNPVDAQPRIIVHHGLQEPVVHRAAAHS